MARDSALLVLVALGVTAGRDGITRASVADLVRWTKLSERAVRYDLRRLVKLGELYQVSKGGGRGRAAVYRITIGAQKRFWSAGSPRKKAIKPALKLVA